MITPAVLVLLRGYPCFPPPLELFGRRRGRRRPARPRAPRRKGVLRLDSRSPCAQANPVRL